MVKNNTWERVEFEYCFSYLKREEGFLYKFHYDKFFGRGSFKVFQDKVGDMKELFYLMSNLRGGVLEIFLEVIEDTLDADEEDVWELGKYPSPDFISLHHTETGLSLNLNTD